jgi:hypothetical protein
MLILFFIILVIFFILCCSPIIIVENIDNIEPQPLTYSEYPNKCDFISQKNAANISFLKEQMDKLTGLPEQVNVLSAKVTSLFAQQQAYADSLTSNTPPSNSNEI